MFTSGLPVAVAQDHGRPGRLHRPEFARLLVEPGQVRFGEPLGPREGLERPDRRRDFGIDQRGGRARRLEQPPLHRGPIGGDEPLDEHRRPAARQAAGSRRRAGAGAPAGRGAGGPPLTPFLGRDGRISILLGRLRPGWRSRSTTTSATSSPESFQASSSPCRPEKSVATEPGMTTLTRMPSCRTSCITDSLNDDEGGLRRTVACALSGTGCGRPGWRY